MSKSFIALVMLVSYAFTAFIGYDLADRYMLKEWNETNAENLTGKVRSKLTSNNATTYITGIEYSYSAEGSSHSATEWGIHNSFGSKLEAKQAINRYIQEVDTAGMKVRFEQLSPSNAYLVSNLKLNRALKGFYYSIGVAFLSTVALIYTILRAKQIKAE
jgi:hypothetical protein